MELDAFFERAWQDYLATTPTARRIRALLEAQGEILVNDHIALRTFAHPAVSADRLAAFFIERGYREGAERYEFPVKKLRARHYEHPAGYPKVFISELLTEAFSAPFQALVADCLARIPTGADFLDLFLGGRPWRLRCADYELLAAESDYAAWVGALGYRPNHFTVSVNHLQRYGDLAALNDLLRGHGFALNQSGGEIKGSPALCLEQSSTVADRLEVAFADGSMTIPTCYYEFARRYPIDPQQPQRLYQGFVSASADRIFESTDRRRDGH